MRYVPVGRGGRAEERQVQVADNGTSGGAVIFAHEGDALAAARRPESRERVIPASEIEAYIGRGVLIVEHAEIRLEEKRIRGLELRAKASLAVLVEAAAEVDPIARRALVIRIDREFGRW